MARSAAQDKRLDAKKQTYLAALRRGLTHSEAAAEADAGHRTVYHWRKNAEFEEDVLDAYNTGTALFEAECRRRALHGILKPIYQGGKRVGTVREFSDRLLEVKLRSRAPDRYRDRVSQEITGAGGGPVTGKIEIELVSPKSRRNRHAEEDE